MRFAAALLIAVCFAAPVSISAARAAPPSAVGIEAAPFSSIEEVAAPNCGRRAHYVRGHRARNGHWIKGRCVRDMRRR